MKFIKIAVLTFLPALAVADQYICFSKKSVGFAYSDEKKQWVEVVFRDNNEKFLISSVDNEKYAYEVKELTYEWATSFCEDGFNRAGSLFCNGLDGSFRINRNTGRYLRSSDFGYYNVTPGDEMNSSDEMGTPFIEIGECSKI